MAAKNDPKWCEVKPIWPIIASGLSLGHLFLYLVVLGPQNNHSTLRLVVIRHFLPHILLLQCTDMARDLHHIFGLGIPPKGSWNLGHGHHSRLFRDAQPTTMSFTLWLEVEICNKKRLSSFQHPTSFSCGGHGVPPFLLLSGHLSA